MAYSIKEQFAIVALAHNVNNKIIKFEDKLNGTYEAVAFEVGASTNHYSFYKYDSNTSKFFKANEADGKPISVDGVISWSEINYAALLITAQANMVQADIDKVMYMLNKKSKVWQGQLDLNEVEQSSYKDLQFNKFNDGEDPVVKF